MGADELSPLARLFNTLLSTCSLILLGSVLVKLRLVDPDRGDMRAMIFYTSNIAFPLLVFSTVATAELGAVDVGAIIACSLGKAIVMICTWVASFLAFKVQRLRSQRFITASIFAFFAVASNDFVIGFPVLDALYGKRSDIDMSTYITANALVGSVLFVPLTMVMLTQGRAMGAHEQGSSASASQRGIFSTIRDIFLNPVIMTTVLGLIYKLALGVSLREEGGKLKLPHPLADVIDLATSSFSPSALFLTGTSLRRPKPDIWPVALVVMKVFVCGYASYFFGQVLIRQKDALDTVQNFTFFYGSLPTSSAPLVFAIQFDPDQCEVVASAILFGLLLAGPNMFMTALFLEQANTDMAATLASVQASINMAGIVCGLVFVLLLIRLRKSWGFRDAGEVLLTGFALCSLVYQVLVLLVNPDVLKEPCEAYSNHGRTPLVWAIAWLQNSSRFMIVLLQFLGRDGLAGSRKQGFKLSSACLLLGLLPAIFLNPNTLNEICKRPANVIGSTSLAENLCWSIILLLLTLAMACMRIIRREVPSLEPLASGVEDEPCAVVWRCTKVLALIQALKFVAQIVNTAEVLMHRDVKGSFAQMLVLEALLEHGQIVLLLAILVSDSTFINKFAAPAAMEQIVPTSDMSSPGALPSFSQSFSGAVATVDTSSLMSFELAGGHHSRQVTA